MVNTRWSTVRDTSAPMGEGGVRRAVLAEVLPWRSTSWTDRYLAALAWTDALIIVAAVAAASWLRFGNNAPGETLTTARIPMVVVAGALIGGWLVSMRACQTLDRRVLGSGPQEYSRVLTACFSVFGLLAIISLAFQLDVSRGFFAIALPLGTVCLLASRLLWRRRLTRRRARGENLERLLVVGESASAEHLVKRLQQNPQIGFEVIGVCLPRFGGRHETFAGVPVWGGFDDVATAVAACGATTVAITSAEALGHSAMQDLSWNLQGMDVEMMVAPGVADIAGPRMMLRPVAGLPLLHIDKPTYQGATKFRKATVDRVGATLLLLMILPVLVAIAVAVKLDSAGPVFYRATRIGLNNQPFLMWKFRSMVVDADSMRASLAAVDEGAGVLFKVRDDPRVTRVGRFIRRYSLDELPQLFNVVDGSMSLVGPRPPLREEVEQYDGRVARRMLVKPGMTGLWQVSGRSDLSWEESVRLDLSYVENWSATQDLVILWRTARAVIGKDGAY